MRCQSLLDLVSHDASMDFLDAVQMEEQASIHEGEKAGWAHGTAIGREQGLKVGNQQGVHFGAEVSKLTLTPTHTEARILLGVP